MSQYDEDYDAAKRATLRELQPLVDAITDAIFLFNKISSQSATPEDITTHSVAMAKQLKRLLALSGLPPPSNETENK